MEGAGLGGVQEISAVVDVILEDVRADGATHDDPIPTIVTLLRRIVRVPRGGLAGLGFVTSLIPDYALEKGKSKFWD